MAIVHILKLKTNIWLKHFVQNPRQNPITTCKQRTLRNHWIPGSAWLRLKEKTVCGPKGDKWVSVKGYIALSEKCGYLFLNRRSLVRKAKERFDIPTSGYFGIYQTELQWNYDTNCTFSLRLTMPSRPRYCWVCSNYSWKIVKGKEVSMANLDDFR